MNDQTPKHEKRGDVTAETPRPEPATKIAGPRSAAVEALPADLLDRASAVIRQPRS